MKYSCIIVDDEPIAQKIIESHLKSVKGLILLEKFDNAVDALHYMRVNEVDVVFLDIHLPQLSGIDLIKSYKRIPKVIITTAYSEYAVEGFELDVIDYLLKPISLPRFLKAVDKVLGSLTASVNSQYPEERIDKDYILVYANTAIIKVKIEKILYVQAFGNYVKIFNTDSKMLLTKATISSYEETLTKSVFVRVHRSFLVNKTKIEKLAGNYLFIEGQKIPIGISFKANLMRNVK